MTYQGKLIGISRFGLGLCFSIPVVLAESEKEKSSPGKKISRSVKPSKLPIYENSEDLYNYEYQGKERSKLEDVISSVRKEVESVCEATEETRDSLHHIFETGKAHSSSTINYFLDEENVAGKVGAISVGGLLGLTLLGRKKGFTKKMFYTSVGVGGTAALVYPNESKQICQDLYENAGDYTSIAYNFVAGVKPQSEATPASSPTAQSSPVNSQPPKPEKESSSKSVDVKENKESKDDVVLQTKAKATKANVEGDFGQSNPGDKDMYSTRS